MYVANLEDSICANSSVVTNYQYDQNIHADSQYLKECAAETEQPEERTTPISDAVMAVGMPPAEQLLFGRALQHPFVEIRSLM